MVSCLKQPGPVFGSFSQQHVTLEGSTRVSHSGLLRAQETMPLPVNLDSSR